MKDIHAIGEVSSQQKITLSTWTNAVFHFFLCHVPRSIIRSKICIQSDYWYSTVHLTHYVRSLWTKGANISRTNFIYFTFQNQSPDCDFKIPDPARNYRKAKNLKETLFSEWYLMTYVQHYSNRQYTVSVNITYPIRYRCLKASPPIADGTGHIFRQGWILAASRGSGFKGASQL